MSFVIRDLISRNFLKPSLQKQTSIMLVLLLPIRTGYIKQSVFIQLSMVQPCEQRTSSAKSLVEVLHWWLIYHLLEYCCLLEGVDLLSNFVYQYFSIKHLQIYRQNLLVFLIALTVRTVWWTKVEWSTCCFPPIMVTPFRIELQCSPSGRIGHYSL
jgi:hypothetical protein